jgi:chemotaxis protein CheD
MVKNKIVVNISDGKVSDDPSTVLTTYSLGSCIGVCMYDPAIKVGSMLHCQLPNSKEHPVRAELKPFMFADTGLKILIDKMLSMGANKKRIKIKIAGGAAMETGPKGFDIGKRNHLAIRKILWKNGMLIDSEDVGGNTPRHLYIDIENGIVTVGSNNTEKQL